MAAAVTALICASSAALVLYDVNGAANATGNPHQAAVPTNAHFWSYVAGIGLYSMGAGVALLEGIERMKQPLPLAQADTALLALGIGLAAFVVSIWPVLRISGARRTGETLVAGLRASQDPALLTAVIAQVAGAIALAVALAGVVLAGQTGAREADGVAALAVGLVLAAVAALFAIEVRRLIVGVQHETPGRMLTDVAPLLPSMQLAPETKSTDPPASRAPASQSAQKPQIHARDGGGKGRGKHRR
jgi:hypothetical protein